MSTANPTSESFGASSPSTARGVCVIMAGGRGTRFWPLSRIDRPKQLQALASGRTLLRDTYERVAPLVGPERILVVTSGSLAAATCAELPELPPENVITEPVGRNTAPCAVLGMGLAATLAPDLAVALLPADHFIPDDDIFREQLAAAFAIAESEPTVVTLGIPPTSPETGYGYLKTAPGKGARRSGLSFVEKPDLATAERYVRGGVHFWNSGIFVWHPGYFQEMATRHLPAVVARMVPVIDSFGTEGFVAALQEAYHDCPAESIDCAVMEKLARFDVLPAQFSWSDLGSWQAWGDLAADLGGNNRGQADLIAIDSTGNVVRSEDRLVVLLGVENLIVVDTGDAVMVCRKGDAQRIREIITCLEKTGRREFL